MDDKESSQETMGVIALIAFIIYVLVRLFTPGDY